MRKLLLLEFTVDSNNTIFTPTLKFTDHTHAIHPVYYTFCYVATVYTYVYSVAFIFVFMLKPQNLFLNISFFVDVAYEICTEDPISAASQAWRQI